MNILRVSRIMAAATLGFGGTLIIGAEAAAKSPADGLPCFSAAPPEWAYGYHVTSALRT